MVYANSGYSGQISSYCGRSLVHIRAGGVGWVVEYALACQGLLLWIGVLIV